MREDIEKLYPVRMRVNSRNAHMTVGYPSLGTSNDLTSAYEDLNTQSMEKLLRLPTFEQSCMPGLSNGKLDMAYNTESAVSLKIQKVPPFPQRYDRKFQDMTTNLRQRFGATITKSKSQAILSKDD